MSEFERLHYEDSGDDYRLKDPFKIRALEAAAKTTHNLDKFKRYDLDISEILQSRGESAYGVRLRSSMPLDIGIYVTEEGIGTKNVVADEMTDSYRAIYHRNAGRENVASIANDLTTSGAMGVSFMMHVGAGENEWFTHEERIKCLFEGTVEGCDLAGLSWGGGESPTLKDIIREGRSILSGSAMGIIFPYSKRLTEDKLVEGDRIILLPSSGVHHNGITPLRTDVPRRLPQGYLTKLSDGQTYLEALMTPAVIYSKMVEEVVQETDVHYATNITGHGWRKIMRSSRDFSYIIDDIPTPQPIFDLIQKYCNLSDYDMYDSHNNGAGFALFVPPSSVEKVLEIAQKHSIGALNAGEIKAGPRQVIIKPKDIILDSQSLQLR